MSKSDPSSAECLNEWQFSLPCKLLELPVDPIKDNYVRHNVHGAIFSHVQPTPLKSPKLASYSEDVLTNILDMDPKITESDSFAKFISGNIVLPSCTPIAHRYGGHQFGVWANQLGDGRAITLGQFINRKGDRWELQLKGAGKTPYSRGADGRAVLRSSIREFLCSEAMFHLGIPTSRAGALVVSSDEVIRDPLYDGRPRYETAAVVLRLAPSWFRFGSFEILARNNEHKLLKTLFDFIVKEHFPDISVDGPDSVVELLSHVARLSTDLVVGWQAVGFTHGVLNTDNMSILGLTIDYGPFGFMDNHDQLYVPNHSDSGARYCYGEQIPIVMYNLMQLTRALSPLMKGDQLEKAATLLKSEHKYVLSKLDESMARKLGLDTSYPELTNLLVEMMQETGADHTVTFRQLSETPLASLDNPDSSLWALATLAKHHDYHKFLHVYRQHLNATAISDEQRMKKMSTINPCYVLRNWMAEVAITAADKGDFSEVDRLLRVLSHPYMRQPEAEQRGYAKVPPSWAKTLVLSCSS